MMKRVVVFTNENNNATSFRRWIKRNGLQGKVRITPAKYRTSVIHATIRGEAALTLFALMFVKYDHQVGIDEYVYPSCTTGMYEFPKNVKW